MDLIYESDFVGAKLILQEGLVLYMFIPFCWTLLSCSCVRRFRTSLDIDAILTFQCSAVSGLVVLYSTSSCNSNPADLEVQEVDTADTLP